MFFVRYFIIFFIAFFVFRYYLKNYLTEKSSDLKEAILVSICYAIAGVFIKVSV